MLLINYTANLMLIFLLAKYFGTFFQKKMIFSCYKQKMCAETHILFIENYGQY